MTRPTTPIVWMRFLRRTTVTTNCHRDTAGRTWSTRVSAASPATRATWVWPLKNPRLRPPADHPCGRAACCAAGTASPTRARHRPPQRNRPGHPVRRRRPPADTATSVSRRKSAPRGLGSQRNPALAGAPGTPSGPSVTRELPRPSRPHGSHSTCGLVSTQGTMRIAPSEEPVLNVVVSAQPSVEPVAVTAGL
jgi:hypothetical protein